jgi:uncharacterized membrane protein YfbV (UPF0208 family)
MSLSIATLVKDGHTYSKIWPMQKLLFALFPECRVIAATKFAYKVMPGLGIFSVLLLVNVHGWQYLPQALAMGGIFISLPLQGQLWLGHRANQPLPPSLLSWYFEIAEKMRKEGCPVTRPQTKPRYMELAVLLKKAFENMDNAFTQRWF